MRSRLKGEKGRPKFKPSGMDQKAGQQQDTGDSEEPAKPRPGSAK